MNTDDFTTNDVILLDQFNAWRFGSFLRVEANPELREMVFCPQHRTYRELWVKAEECLRKSESKALRDYFNAIARKYRDKYIYAQ